MSFAVDAAADEALPGWRAADAPPAALWRAALLELGGWLRARNYRFVTPTPSTHARRLRHAGSDAATLQDAFGWSRPFGAGLLPPDLHRRLVDARLVVRDEGAADECWWSRVRFSSLAGLLFAHSSYPTIQPDSVFFGPDTYRFARFVAGELALRPLPPGARVIDIGCGSGAGGIAASSCVDGAVRTLVLADINPAAIQHAIVNAALASVAAEPIVSNLYGAAVGEFDLVISNPPYLVDAGHRTYRDGGGSLGGELSERIVREGLDRLRPGGRLILYTGSAIVAGHDAMETSVRDIARRQGFQVTYEEIDPDVFGEELDGTAYAHCDRIAAVGAVIRRASR